MIWELWKERNRRIFQENEVSLVHLYGTLEAAISKLLSVVVAQLNPSKIPFSKENSEIQSKCPYIRYRSINGPTQDDPDSNQRRKLNG